MNQTTPIDHPHPSALTQFRWWTFYQAMRIATGAAFFIIAAITARWIGLWFTLPIATCAAALLCASVAQQLSRAAGRVSHIYRLALIVLPIGLRRSRGRLLPPFACSTALWSAIATAGAIYSSTHSHTPNPPSPHTLLRLLFIASLFADSATFITLTLQAVKQSTPTSSGIKPLAMTLTGCLSLIIAGIGLWMTNFPRTALLLTGGPPAVAAIIYTLFILSLIATPPK